MDQETVMPRAGIIQLLTFIGLLYSGIVSSAESLLDPLPSWHDGTNKQSIIQFVNDVTNKASKDYVIPENRIATFDNDGTLWLEQPEYTQVIFMLSRLKELAKTHPEWQLQEPVKSVMKNNISHLTDEDIEQIFTLTSSDISPEEYIFTIQKWLASHTNPHFKRPYTQLIYQPMLELIHYLQKNAFTVYIVSGGGQDFVRAFSPSTYHIPVDNVIGSSSQTDYQYINGKPTLMKTPKPLLISNFAGKPKAIYLFVGKKPILAIGNSDGDRQMLEWTQSGEGKRLLMLIHHDDAKREYAYDTQSKVGTFSAALFQEANKKHWSIVSMKNDWKTIFPNK